MTNAESTESLESAIDVARKLLVYTDDMRHEIGSLDADSDLLKGIITSNLAIGMILLEIYNKLP